MTKWQNMIEFLKRKGMTNAGISAECECTAGAITLLSQGKRMNPSYDLGSRIVTLATRLGYKE